MSPEGREAGSFGRRDLGFGERLMRSVAAGGPISLSQYMAQVNSHYYGTRDPLGAEGDFTTAPEISQMFGELVGLCLADVWLRAAQGQPPVYVELGPGRGTLAEDALRAMEQVRLAPLVHFVETSPVLRERQKARISHVMFHENVDTLPMDRPLLIAANEFFDALPISQSVKTPVGWREMMVGLGDEAPFAPLPGDRPADARVPEALRDAPAGSIHESSPVSAAIMLTLARRVARQGGCLIVIDYGYEGPALGDTLQAVRAHDYADPFAQVGDNDLTAHVDFTMLANAARQEGLAVFGPVSQGSFLTRLGIDARAAALTRNDPKRAAEIETARLRLVADDQMGRLFKVLACVHPAWPGPGGFE